MAVSTVASVHELAAELLTACEDVLATTIGGTPAFTTLNPGLPALDRQCDTLFVYEGSPSVRGVGDPSSGVASMRFAVKTQITLTVFVARCIAPGETVLGKFIPPTAAQLTVDARKVMEDSWALWNGVVTKVFDGTLFEGHPCRGVEYVDMTPLDPQGGMAGWTLTLAVDLDGYTVTV